MEIEDNDAISEFEKVTNAIIVLRDKKVMIDADLAKVYQVTTKQLNQAVKRNQGRFPEDFMFQLNKDEKDKVVTERDHLQKLKFSRFLPYAFTEHGALMLASVLNTPVAIKACVQVVRAFVKMREVIEANNRAFEEHLSRRIEELEEKNQKQFELLLDAIRTLKDDIAEESEKISQEFEEQSFSENAQEEEEDLD